MDESRKKALGGLIFGVGLIALLIGAMTDAYPTTVGVISMLGIWFIGGAIVALIFGGKKEEPPKKQEQKYFLFFR